MNYPVSIIVPIYNVEQYLEKCLVSLFEQNFVDIEYVFVNDCTPDNSMDVLKAVIERYPQRKQHIKIIEHENNKGSGAARKTGIRNCCGEYIIQIDADDWCELNMISSLYQQAQAKDADIVMCDFYESYSDYKKYRRIKYREGREFSMLLSAELVGACWNKLIKKSLYFENNVFPPEHISMAEDKHLMIRLAFFAKRFAYLNTAYVNYRQDNNGALTKSITKTTMGDITSFINDIGQFLSSNKCIDKYKVEYAALVISHHHYLYTKSKGVFGVKEYMKYINFRFLFDTRLGIKIRLKILIYFLGIQIYMSRFF